MPELQQLNAGHAAAVLSFELDNRDYFAASVSDRGDEYFEKFAEHYDALLAEQENGVCAFHVLVDEDGSVLGRFNLYDLTDGVAELGYRVAQRVTGRGVATATVLQLCQLAVTRHCLHTLRAGTSTAQRRLPARAGQGRVREARPGGPGQARRQAGHLVPARSAALGRFWRRFRAELVQ